LQMKMYRWLTHEKMIPFGNANQNYTKILSPPFPRVAIIKGGAWGGNNKQLMLVRMQGKRNTTHCRWGCKLVQPLWKSVWRFLRKLKLELSYVPALPLLGICKGI
jgi:hypothetical protein